MKQTEVIIIGAGVAGLAAAIELSAAGYAVTVLERMKAPGGKMREVVVGDRPIDAGPTVFTMRWVFDAILAKANTTLETEINLQKARVLARHVWDGDPDTIFDLHADINQSADAIGRLFGSKEAKGYLEFCAEAKHIFTTLRDPYMAAQRPSFFDLPKRVGLSKTGDLLRTKPFSSMWNALGKHFKDPRLQQLFGRYATYCGSSPYQAAATLMLVAHVEQDGVWLVEGGMHKLAIGLRRVAERMGCHFRFDQHVASIDTNGRTATGVTLATGEHLKADTIICNADVAAVASSYFGQGVQYSVPKMDPQSRSLSAMTWQVNAKTKGFPLSRHTVFFSKDYKREFNALFNKREMVNEPTTYICAQDRDDVGALANKGKERLLVLINAPAIGDQHDFAKTEIWQNEDRAFDLLKRCGLEVDTLNGHMDVTTPTGFDALFPATGGALYGRASHGWMASFQRPAAKTKIQGLYLASGSAHPGPGIPMAALSGKLAAEQIMKDRPKYHTFSPRSSYLEAAQ